MCELICKSKIVLHNCRTLPKLRTSSKPTVDKIMRRPFSDLHTTLMMTLYSNTAAKKPHHLVCFRVFMLFTNRTFFCADDDDDPGADGVDDDHDKLRRILKILLNFLFCQGWADKFCPPPCCCRCCRCCHRPASREQLKSTKLTKQMDVLMNPTQN